jgi:hypothetical protein
MEVCMNQITKDEIQQLEQSILLTSIKLKELIARKIKIEEKQNEKTHLFIIMK